MYLPLVLLASLGVASASQKNVMFTFEPDYSGVYGDIRLDYDPKMKSNEVKITANLDFKRVDLAALTKVEPKCYGKVTEYAWYIHTKWQQPATYKWKSAMLDQCATDYTANHYDPYRSCGPASYYVDAPECAGRPANYMCTPANYKKDPWLCEVGDLSGKFGKFKPDKEGIAKGMWVDKNFPTWMIPTSGWSIVVHAVCGDAAPRLACAGGYKADHMKDEHDGEYEEEEEYEEEGEYEEEEEEEGKDEEEHYEEDASTVPYGETDDHAPAAYGKSRKNIRVHVSAKHHSK